MGEKIKVVELFRGTGGAIVKNATVTSHAIDLRHVRPDGNFALHMINVGGTITATLLVCSTATGTFIAPSTAVTIFTTKAAGSHYASFTPPVAAFIKILFTETNVATVTSMDAWLNYQ
jgi:hypothetical protein